MLATVQQKDFLANEKNKMVELLIEMLTARGIGVSTATGDTEGGIVRCDLNKVTSHSPVVVIGGDVDLLILLTALIPPDRNVYFMKPERGDIDKIYSTRQLQELPFSGSILPHQVSEHDLNNHQYNSFVKSFTKVLHCHRPKVQPSNLSECIYRHNNVLTTTLNPARWGWVRDDGGVLNPIKKMDPIAPDSILNSMFCYWLWWQMWMR
ncbi:hypothetical protein PR048_025839 [Dryococelus australis]|uniref:Uncharacterized protein n=1 Tax=Dryococelus australis TaxID=614101 RepID=A0ABQ9GJN6_9NEOP|nr:hypothetical protein PR048_025839 [Dryococelus australis]